MLVRCPECNWRYLLHRRAIHKALHDLLPIYPCPVRPDLAPRLHVLQFPIDLVAVLLHGLYMLQPQRQVSLCLFHVALSLYNVPYLSFSFSAHIGPYLCLFAFQDINLHQVCHAVFFDHWLGVDEPPFGLDVAVRLIRQHLVTPDFISFRDAICYWAENFILRRPWY